MTNISRIFHSGVFDCDGTFVANAEEKHGMAVRDTLRSIWQKANVMFDEPLFHRVWTDGLGKGIVPFYESLMNEMTAGQRKAIALVSPDAQHFEAQYEAHYCDGAEQAGLVVRRGMGDLIADLRNGARPVGIISNAKQLVLDATVSATGLSDHMSLIVGIDTVQKAGYLAKPEPGSYLYGAREMSVDLHHALGMEDTESGLRSLVAAGVGTIIFCQNNPDVQPSDYILQHATAICGPEDCVSCLTETLADQKARTLHKVVAVNDDEAPARVWTPAAVPAMP